MLAIGLYIEQRIQGVVIFSYISSISHSFKNSCYDLSQITNCKHGNMEKHAWGLFILKRESKIFT